MPIGCVGTSDFDFSSTQTWPIGGDIVEWASHNFSYRTLLVTYVDGSYVIVFDVRIFNAIMATESTILGLIATNPTACQAQTGNLFILDQSPLDGGNVLG